MTKNLYIEDPEGIESIARGMFDAYGAHCEWKTFDGREMPKWEGINDAVRSHWKAAAVWAILNLAHDWDDPEQFHGEDGSGLCALCHSEEGDECAYCKAHDDQSV